MNWLDIENVPKDGTVVDLWDTYTQTRWTDMVWNSTSPANPSGAWKKEYDDWMDEVDYLEPSHYMIVEPPI